MRYNTAMPAIATTSAHNFWNQTHSIIGLSPMDGVTDQPFRYIQKKYGNPDVIYTEFTSVEGVCHGATRLLKDFLFDETQRPILAQVYGTTPDFFYQTAVLLCELGFDGIDINMGCPAKNVAHSGAGAALISTPELAKKIIKATQKGVTDYNNGMRTDDCSEIVPEIVKTVKSRHEKLPKMYQAPRVIPVSVKTRVGFSQPVIDTWIKHLLETEPAAIAIHGRILKQYYGGEANWDLIGQAATIAKGSGTKILGNGDIQTRAEAKTKIDTYQLDGILIGRASMGNPFVFLENPPESPSRFAIALEHAQLYESAFSHQSNYNFLPMRKHLGWYVREVPHASEVRVALFQANSAAEVATILERYDLR